MKMKRRLRGKRNRKSSIASVDTEANNTRSSSFVTSPSPQDEGGPNASARPNFFPPASPGQGSEEAIEDDAPRGKRRHFHRRKARKSKRKGRNHEDGGELQPTISEKPEHPEAVPGENEPRRVDFAVQNEVMGESATESGPGGVARRPFPALRGMSVKNLAPTVFVQKPGPPGAPAAAPAGPVPRVRYGIRRTNSLPDKLNMNQHQIRPPGAMLPSQVPLMALTGGNGAQGAGDDEDQHLPQTASIILLLVSTALVAVCAEFLIGSIEEVVSTSSVGETFIGLIILPIVGEYQVISDYLT